MTPTFRTAARAARRLLAILALTAAGAAHAGPIDSACSRAGRAAASPALCGCLQEVADRTLRGADQRRAARFFDDPERAQKVRMSASARDNEFWKRYRNFAAAAEAFCAAPSG